MPDPVGDAVNTINSKLDTSGWFNTVTNGETHDIVNAITKLPAGQADQVIDRLQQGGKLDAVAHEVMDGDWFGNGGLSGDERRAFFADMAGKLDGQSLADLSNAFAKADNGGFEPVKELGDAIATHASPQVKIDYIASMKAQVDAKSSHSDNAIFVNSTHFQDAEATAVGTVLGSLRGAQAEQGFNAIGDKLPDVLSSAVDGTMTTTTSMGGATNTMTWNADKFEAIMDAAASTNNPDLKAHVFDQGADTLKQVQGTNSILGGLTVVGKDATVKQMTDGLSAVLNSDTSGVVKELTYNQDSMDGSGMATYAKAMLDQGREAELGQQMGRLQFGNGGNENAVDRLNETVKVPGTNQDRRPNAGALGYFVGSVYAAAESRSKDAASDRTSMTNILKSALTVGDKAASVAKNPLLATGFALAKEWVQTAVNAAIKDEGLDPGILLEKGALPVNPQTRELGVGDDVASAFEDRLASVARTAKP